MECMITLAPCASFEVSQGKLFGPIYIEVVPSTEHFGELKKHGAGGLKKLGQVLVFSIKTDGNVSRRISLTL